MTQELKRLNHYPEFQTDPQINQVIHYINTGVFPPGLNQRQQNRYAQKFNGFLVQFGLLRYRPNPNINLVVCLNANKQVVMQNIFNNIRRGLGQGLASFYHQVCDSYLNIKKSDTDDFLRRQGDYQSRGSPVARESTSRFKRKFQMRDGQAISSMSPLTQAPTTIIIIGSWSWSTISAV